MARPLLYLCETWESTIKEERKDFIHNNKAIQFDPEYALAYFERGLFYAGNNEREKAIADLQRAWELCEPYNICEQAWQELEKLKAK
jgi:regulator of sirC expression with transglutaminase-like and TPR domain